MTDTSEAVKHSIAGVFDRAAESYDRTGVDFFGTVGATLVELAAVKAGEHVLELGSGRGAATFPAAERVGPHGRVHAIDLADGMVAMLRADLEAAALPQVTCAVGDAERPDAEPRAWDVVLASLVLFFLPDHRTAMRSYRELLRPGGRLAFSWFADDDARWEPIFEQLVAELPEGERGPKRPGGGPFENPEAMDAFLRHAGYAPVTHLRPLTVLYPDEAAWWATLWSHGRRATMEKLRDAGVLESTTARMSSHLDAVRRSDGSLEWKPVMGYTIASPS